MTSHAGTRRTKSDTWGFTLLELTVAIAVFAVLSAISYGGLWSILDTQKQVQSISDELTGLQIAVGSIGRDSAQIVNRGIRDSLGDPMPPLIADESREAALEFTCYGILNRSGIPTPALIRVGYGLRQGNLSRFVWRVLDRSYDSEPEKTELVSGVTTLRLRFLDAHRRWQSRWPPSNATTTAVLPLAMEMTLELEKWGKITRLYRIPG